MTPRAILRSLASGAALAALLLGAPAGAAGQEPAPAEPAPPAITVTPGFAADAWVAAGEPIWLALSRPIAPDAGRLVVMLGRTDLTALFDRAGDRLVYRAGAPPLPHGEGEVVVHLVTPDQAAAEVGRFPIRVLSRRGFERAELTPKLDVSNSGQVAEGHSSPELRPARPTYQNVTFGTGVQTHHVRGGWTVRTQSNMAGVSNQEEALRFGELQGRAPRFDLSDYLVEVQRGAASLALGHVSFGAARHLVNGFASRGVRSALRVGDRVDLSLAAMNGSSVVGWDNFSGLERRRHRVVGTTLGVEMLPARPGGLRVEATVLDGSLLPLSSFSQGAITDAERSRGLSVGVAASDAGQRVRLGAGYTQSRFVNPVDPTLAQGEELVPVRAVTRGARWVDATVAVLQGAQLTPTVQASLTAAYRHERVDPLFRSVAAPSQADLQSNTVEVNAAVGQLSVVASHTRSNDNLAGIPSVLKTLTRNDGLQVALPVRALARSQSPWWPALSVAHTRTHQFGAALPVGGEFAESHVPDQVSSNQTASLQWQWTRWRLGYSHNRSRQDNRQVGRERSDFSTRIHGLALGVQPLSSLDVGVEGAVERADNEELGQLARTRRLGVTADWRPWSRTGLSVGYSTTRLADEPRTSTQDNSEMRVELSQGLSLTRRVSSGMPAQLFVRYARQRGLTSLAELGRDLRDTWTINTGVTVRTF